MTIASSPCPQVQRHLIDRAGIDSALTTAFGSTSQNSAILRRIEASIGRSERQTMKSGCDTD
jgi:hypothetical protein